MPGVTLPTITLEEIERKHSSKKSCYVRLGPKIFDVTDFLPDHPGGDDLVLEYAGKDVTTILTDTVSHLHSESAYEILEEGLVGFLPAHEADVAAAATAALNGTASGAAKDVAAAMVHSEPAINTPNPLTGMSSAEELSIETDYGSDFKTHKFIDLKKPMLMQIWRAGWTNEFYLEQVHRPRHYKGGKSAPLFGNFLEPFTKTAWWVVPIIWLPMVAYGLSVANEGLEKPSSTGLSFFIGCCLWTILEYGLHRGLFHMDDYLPEGSAAQTLHFLLHGIHHYLPMDRLRLVMPPALFIVLATPIYYIAHILFFFNWYVATAVYCGGVFGYVCYDLTHYFLHHKNLPSYYKELKKYHLQHHFADYQNGFGVTSRFWDKVFGTELPPLPQKTS